MDQNDIGHNFSGDPSDRLLSADCGEGSMGDGIVGHNLVCACMDAHV